MSFIHDDFLLYSDAAKRLYHDYAADMPIYDYHCHLPPADLAANRRFNDLYELWLEGDHYKWRAMRANGVDERYCTGDADPYDKFVAFAGTVPQSLRSPLYHWTHLELKRYFDIDTTLNETTAPEVWEQANAKIAHLPCSSIMHRFKVALIGTTDDPTDSLEHHRAMNDDSPFADTVIAPTYRPDKAHNLTNIKAWNKWVDALAKATGTKCDKFEQFVDALRARHAFFHEVGARVSDHGLTHVPVATCSEKDAKKIFKHAREGEKVDRKDQDPLHRLHDAAVRRAERRGPTGPCRCTSGRSATTINGRGRISGRTRGSIRSATTRRPRGSAVCSASWPAGRRCPARSFTTSTPPTTTCSPR